MDQTARTAISGGGEPWHAQIELSKFTGGTSKFPATARRRSCPTGPSPVPGHVASFFDILALASGPQLHQLDTQQLDRAMGAALSCPFRVVLCRGITARAAALHQAGPSSSSK